ncbi:MAG: methyltransferase domain-containing protein [Gammaproteobacteria bacterium]|nr:methyltransferase domain-containing protein [Gammaproteobacteria bacterium]
MEELFSSPDISDFPLSLHLAMIQDDVRMKAFSQALRQSITPQSIVIDIGTGTGILAFLAARYGARKVIGLDRGGLIREARRIKALNFADAPVTFHTKDVICDELPRAKADVLVCELLGNFGIDENVVEVLIRARTEMLKHGGVMIPRDLRLMMAPVQCTKAYRGAVSWQKKQWDIDFSPLQERAYNTVYQTSGEEVQLLAAPVVLAAIDFTTIEGPITVSRVSITFRRAGKLHGLSGWFRSTLGDDIVLDSGPDTVQTHWGQVFFPIGEPLSVKRGGRLEVEFKERLAGDEIRWSWSGEITPAEGAQAVLFNYRAIREFPGYL